MQSKADKFQENTSQTSAEKPSKEGIATKNTHNKLQNAANTSPQTKQATQLQADADNYVTKKNKTGLPDDLKSGIENLSGYSMDDVKVHYNSSKPAQLQAHAYAQGNNIHLASGQEKHLPHEAWHVIQQKQGRVKPTMQMKGKISINDDVKLEKEADFMGEKAKTFKNKKAQLKKINLLQKTAQLIIQRIEYSNAIIGNNYIVDGKILKLISKEYGWLKFNGLETAIRASDVQEVPPTQSAVLAGPYSKVTEEYTNWNPEKEFEAIDTPFGPFNARHNRKAPFITSNTTQYPNTNVSVDYSDLISALKEQKINDSEIASILLDAKSDELTNPDSIRAASLLIGIVYLAEEWRKQGAVKIFRAILRLIISGKMNLSDIPRVFEFVDSATNGREQVSRIQQVLQGEQSIELLDEDDTNIFGAMSPIHQGDLDSDDETRSVKESDFKNGRTWGIHGENAKKRKINHEDIFNINHVFYNISDPRIDHDGQCLWDTLMLFNIAQNDLQNAADNIANLTYGDYVDIDQLTAIVTYLNANGYDLSLSLDIFEYNGTFIRNETIGNGSTTHRLGLVVAPDGLGHFIPALN